MSNQFPDGNDKLLSFIATTVETMRGEMTTMRDEMATKSDLEQVSAKVVSLQDEVAFVGGQIETMREQMATKSDIARLEDKLTVETTAVRGDIEQVQLRLNTIEGGFSSRSSHIETELSRLRSVVYLLVKDKPEMLRLLGQAPPASDEGRP